MESEENVQIKAAERKGIEKGIEKGLTYGQ
jgi:hypothetical protein